MGGWGVDIEGPREVRTWWMMGEGQVGTLAQQLPYGRYMLTPMFRAGLDGLESSSRHTFGQEHRFPPDFERRF